MMAMQEFIAGSFLFFSTLFGCLLSIKRRRKNAFEIRLKRFLPGSSLDGVREATAKVQRKPIHIRFISTMGKLFSGFNFVKKWTKELEYAAIPLKAEEFFSLKLIIAAIGLGVASLLGYQNYFLAVYAIVGYKLPNFYLKRKKAKRFARLVPQLAAALGTMASALRSGFSFMQCMQLVAREVPDPLGPEFERTMREINLGIPMDEAFEQMVKRLPNQELDLVVTALMIQRTTGGNLAELLDTMQETIVDRIRLKEELNALIAQGRLSSWIVTILPIGMFLYIRYTNSDYLDNMLTDPIGWGMMGIGIFNLILGWFSIQKIIKIEV